MIRVVVKYKKRESSDGRIKSSEEAFFKDWVVLSGWCGGAVCVVDWIAGTVGMAETGVAGKF